jgi:hypothetical protein
MQRSATHLRCYMFYVGNFIRRREFVLHYLSFDGTFVESGKAVRLRFAATGCHKIILGNKLVLRGNSREIFIPFDEAVRPLQIEFRGRNGSVSKALQFKGRSVSVENSEPPKTVLPVVLETTSLNKPKALITSCQPVIRSVVASLPTIKAATPKPEGLTTDSIESFIRKQR